MKTYCKFFHLIKRNNWQFSHKCPNSDKVCIIPRIRLGVMLFQIKCERLMQSVFVIFTGFVEGKCMKFATKDKK